MATGAMEKMYSKLGRAWGLVPVIPATWDEEDYSLRSIQAKKLVGS
jgi:hypothetical protein